MTIQSTQCAGEELSELEEWLKSKGLTLVEKKDDDLRPGEYMKSIQEPKDASSGGSPTWKVSWHPPEE